MGRPWLLPLKMMPGPPAQLSDFAYEEVGAVRINPWGPIIRKQAVVAAWNSWSPPLQKAQRWATRPANGSGSADSDRENIICHLPRKPSLPVALRNRQLGLLEQQRQRTTCGQHPYRRSRRYRSSTTGPDRPERKTPPLLLPP